MVLRDFCAIVSKILPFKITRSTLSVRKRIALLVVQFLTRILAREPFGSFARSRRYADVRALKHFQVFPQVIIIGVTKVKNDV